jgi:cell wall-associated NlpC family hydrolase
VARIIKRLSAAERTAFIAAARSFAGVPFRHRGRSERGLDCLGLIVVAMQAVGRLMADRASYGRNPVNDGIAEAARAHFGKPILLKNLRPGDVVLMQWHQQPNHVAIVTDYPGGGLALIHSLAGKCVVEHRLADPWPRRIFEAYRP